MGGWKTWVAGLLGIASGAATILKTVADGVYDFEIIQQGIAMLVAGLGVLGLGHKIEKSGGPQ